jgi:hemerythrin-like domain-containing protein
MTAFRKMNDFISVSHVNKRREFIRNGILFGTVTGIAGLSLATGCSKEAGEGISPAEDLMREHGVLERILLIYDACKGYIAKGEQFPEDALKNSASLVKSFIEEYHEKLEEEFLFPRFIKANSMTDLVRVLKDQHAAGRHITAQIIESAGTVALNTPEAREKMVTLIDDFARMYRPHKSREDTELFPEMRKVIPAGEYFELGEDFEDKEHELFGEEGFESVVKKIIEIEIQLGINELSGFTPANH